MRAGQGSTASLTVDGGSLTATGTDTSGAGILFWLGDGVSGSGTSSLAVGDNAVVKASGVDGEIASNSNPVTPSGYGIVFNNGAGTVYGDVTLQEDLEIGEGESLALDTGAALDAGGHNVIVDGGTVDEGLKSSLGDSVKYAPAISRLIACRTARQEPGTAPPLPQTALRRLHGASAAVRCQTAWPWTQAPA